MKAAKLVWSNNGWTFPQGSSAYGVQVDGPIINYMYGLEEFLFNEELINRKLGYLDCYRKNNIEHFEDVLLFTLTNLPRPRQILVVGIMRGVEQIKDHEKIQIWNDMQQAEYLKNVANPAFQLIEGSENGKPSLGVKVFTYNNYGTAIRNLPMIQGETPKGFFINLRYKEIEIFPEVNWINLTNIDPGVNRAWKRLTNLYKLENRPMIEAALRNFGLL